MSCQWNSRPDTSRRDTGPAFLLAEPVEAVWPNTQDVGGAAGTIEGEQRVVLRLVPVVPTDLPGPGLHDDLAVGHVLLVGGRVTMIGVSSSRRAMAARSCPAVQA